MNFHPFFLHFQQSAATIQPFASTVTNGRAQAGIPAAWRPQSRKSRRNFRLFSSCSSGSQFLSRKVAAPFRYTSTQAARLYSTAKQMASSPKPKVGTCIFMHRKHSR